MANAASQETRHRFSDGNDPFPCAWFFFWGTQETIVSMATAKRLTSQDNDWR